MLAGAAIGVAVVGLYAVIDYLGQSDKRLYFIDHKDALITLLILGLLIGGAVGFGWAITTLRHAKDGEEPSRRTPET
jgi:hypothetical protein